MHAERGRERERGTDRGRETARYDIWVSLSMLGCRQDIEIEMDRFEGKRDQLLQVTFLGLGLGES
jgi:hypothetical protein